MKLTPLVHDLKLSPVNSDEETSGRTGKFNLNIPSNLPSEPISARRDNPTESTL